MKAELDDTRKGDLGTAGLGPGVNPALEKCLAPLGKSGERTAGMITPTPQAAAL